MPSRIDLNLMQVFDALVRERSVSRAGERLGIGQPAASAALSRLRALFGDELFVREPGGMVPTDRALQAHPAIAGALEAIRRAVTPESAFDPLREQRTFRVSGGDYAAMTLLPRLYAILRREAPLCDLRFRFVEKDGAAEMLEDGTLDAALGVFPRVPKSLQRQPLVRERFVCLVRRDHPEIADGLTLDAYCRLPHVLVTERGDETGAVDDALRRTRRARRVALTVPHLLSVPMLVASSDSIATVAEQAARRCREIEPRLVLLEPPLPLAGWDLSQLWARRRSGDAALAWLRGALRRSAVRPIPADGPG